MKHVPDALAKRNASRYDFSEAGPSMSRSGALLDDVFAAFNRSDAPGGVVGISRRGMTIYRRAFGLASVQHRIANTPLTRVRIGSVSKQFTCLALLLLAEDGRLDIDTPVGRYLPGLLTASDAPTIRHFMTHTSGHRCTLDLGTLANGLAPQPPDWQLRALLRQTGINFAPSQGQMYCNGTFHALTYVIESASGESFESFMQSRIFEPLGMRNTQQVKSDLQLVPGMATGHLASPQGGWERGPADSELLGDGGLVSTVDDMLKWLAHLNSPNKIVGSATTWRLMFEPARLSNGYQSVYSMGLRRHRYRGLDVISHSGAVTGFNAQMLTVPTHGLDVIIMINGAPVRATELAKQALDILLGDESLGERQPLASVSNFGHLVGSRYLTKTGLLVAFEDVDGHLGIRLANMAGTPVLLEEEDQLRIGFEDIGEGPFVWEKSALKPDRYGLPPVKIPLRFAGYEETLTRLEPVAGEGIALGDRRGRYRCRDLDAEATLDLSGGDLVLKLRGDYSGWRSFRLEAFSSQVFGAQNEDDPNERYALTFEAEATGFRIDTFRARRIAFEKIEGDA